MDRPNTLDYPDLLLDIPLFERVKRMIDFGPFNHAAEPADPRQRDEQEAHSKRYGPNAFMVLPLSSGRLAVLAYMRELHAIVDTLPEAVEAAESIEMNVWRRNAERLAKRPMEPQKTLVATKSAGELGL